jgi:dolichol-phosphate mannosyltransferase
LNIPNTLEELLSFNSESIELELIFVDDGSTDRSYELLREYKSKHPKTIKLVKLTKNFGQIQATRAGLKYATGQCVGIISADLQDPPELFHQMMSEWRKGFKLVFAERTGREDKGFGKYFSLIYWRMVRYFALPNYPVGGFDFCLLDSEMVATLNQISEKHTQIFPLIYSLGYKYKSLPYIRRERRLGKSQWTFLKKFKMFIDTFVAFSYAPIRLVSLMGALSFLFSTIYSIWIFSFYFLHAQKITGWTTLVLLTTFFGGLTLLSLGIIGEYLWRILEEVRGRPLYIVEKAD